MSAGKPAFDNGRRLMRVIATLSDERDVFSKDGRELTAHLAADETPLDVLLQEISETVLHRMLVFTSTRFGSIRLEVAERRVLRVEKPADAYTQVNDGIFDKLLSFEDAGAICGFLEENCNSAGDLSVVAELPENRQIEPFGGLPVDLLCQLRTVRAAMADEESSLSHALEMTLQLGRAALIMRDDQVLAKTGPAADLADLNALRSVSQVQCKDEDFFRFWIGGLDHPIGVLRFSRGKFYVAALMPLNNLEKCVDLWCRGLG